jgi:predicted membrane-bound mannosyltransferase
MARRVEQIEGEPLVLSAHHRRGNRDAALALDRHPIRAHPPPLAARLDLARLLDRAAKEQQFWARVVLPASLATFEAIRQ